MCNLGKQLYSTNPTDSHRQKQRHYKICCKKPHLPVFQNSLYRPINFATFDSHYFYLPKPNCAVLNKSLEKEMRSRLISLVLYSCTLQFFSIYFSSIFCKPRYFLTPKKFFNFQARGFIYQKAQAQKLWKNLGLGTFKRYCIKPFLE